MINAQKNTIRTMINDDIKANGMSYVLELRTLLDKLIEADKINDLKKEFKDEIESIGDLEICDLFNDLNESFFFKIINLSNYIKEAFQIEKANVRYLLYINYYDLLNNDVIDKNTLALLRFKLLQIRSNLRNNINGPQKKKTSF